MIWRSLVVAAGLLLTAAAAALAEGGDLNIPATVTAGAEFSVQSTGSGKAVLYIVGPGQALRRDVQLGEPTVIAAGVLINAGRYLAVLTGGSSTEKEGFNVVPADHPSSLSFLARPSRLPVGLHNGISGAVYVFDAYHNLITKPTSVTFDLSNTTSPAQSRTVETRDGAAWTQMDSSSKEGAAKFVARVGDVSSTRVIEEVPGDPCGLRMTARKTGKDIQLQTDPLRDCSGNPVPDGTIVTFTEASHGGKTTVDVPLKRGIAQAEVPDDPGATISVATGVVMGNEIHWSGHD